MDISEIRVKLVRNSKERLKAVCSVTFESEFVIRDLKVIEGGSGLFVAMPSRKLSDHCPKCRMKNHLRARFCNECGQKLDDRRADRVRGGRARLHADIAHPINSECRSRIQASVVEAYNKELERSREPGYRPPDYDDDGDGAVDPGGGYAELVADLRKDAEVRHGDRSQRDDSGAPADDKPEAPADTLVAELKKEAAERRAVQAQRDDDAAPDVGEPEADASKASADSTSGTEPSPDVHDEDDFGAGIV